MKLNEALKVKKQCPKVVTPPSVQVEKRKKISNHKNIKQCGLD